MSNHEYCYAIKGRTIVDFIEPDTGLTQIYGKTLEQCQSEYPKDLVEQMTFEQFCDSKAEAQDVPVAWEATTEENYWYLLEVLPPAAMAGGCFLVGEPWDHHAKTGQPRFQAVMKRGTEYVVSSRPMTRKEFKEAVDKAVYS